VRDFFYAANWKMNKTPTEAVGFFREFQPALEKKTWVKTADHHARRVVFFVPALLLPACEDVLRGQNQIELGGQNIHAETKGAFTGENSAAVLKSMGIGWALVGHSERRSLFGETDALTARKMKTALTNDLSAMLCVGETLIEREGGDTIVVVARQLEAGLADIFDLIAKNPKRIAIAYEPVWAIGTGKVATPEQASEVHQAIRKWLTGKFGDATAKQISILYGGSVKPDNAKQIGAKQDIDGFLVGGASLECASFLGLF
jgi:triosephosphate isomerase